MKTKTMFRFLAAGLLAAGLSPAGAVELRPDGLAVQAGGGGNGSAMAGVGIVWNWDFERLRRKAELTAHTELMLNHLRADDFGGGSQGFTQVVVLPSLRMRLDQGRSPWFLELGIGASWMDKLYVTPKKTFSTQWNFYDMLGFGYSLDDQRRHELGLRWVHISNAGIKQPNPGQDFLQLRYVAHF
jgi:lipid A 3-O-deacylase